MVHEKARVSPQRFERAIHLQGVDDTKTGTRFEQKVRPVAEAFELEFARHRDRLVRICRSLVGDDAEDVVQDAYLLGRAKVHQLRRLDLMESWLTRIAINECYRRHRRRQRFLELLAGVSHEQPAESDPDLRTAIERLPFRERTIVVLHYGHGLSLEEVADLLDLKGPTVRSVLWRSRRRLREQLERRNE